MDPVGLTNLTARVRQGRLRGGDLVGAVVRALREHVDAGALPPGSRLANEMLLAEQLQVSRATLREAVRLLIHDGYLIPRRGIGTFVAPAPGRRLFGQIDVIRSLSDLIAAMGATPGVRDLHIGRVAASRDTAAALEVAPGAPVARIVRTRLIDGRPLAWANEFLPLRQPDSFAQLQRFDGSALYRFLREELGLLLLHGTLAITAVAATPAIAVRLGIVAGRPLLLMREVVFGEDQRPLVLAINHYNSALAEFRLLRSGLAA